MSESHHFTGENSPAQLDVVAHELFSEFHPADMQFNIGRIEGFPSRGLDIITADGGRVYMCQGYDLQSEALVSQKLGGAAVLKVARIVDEVAIYKVPNGSRTLAKSFKQAPYTPEYMNRQAYRTGQFVGKLRRIDEGMFGLEVQDIALTYGVPDRANQDDVNLTVIPPLKKQGEQSLVTDEALAQQTAWFFSQAQLYHFLKGLRNE